MLGDHVLAWFDDPDGGARFSNQRDGIKAHDWACESLNHVWLPRKGGVTCLSDTFMCDGCSLTFFMEGIGRYDDACPESNHWYCHCCAARITTCDCPRGETP